MSVSFQSFIELRRRLDGMERLLKDRENVNKKKGFPPQDTCEQWMVSTLKNKGMKYLAMKITLCRILYNQNQTVL